MAILDTDRGVVTVRLVFDGLPRSGKTTTVRSLAGGLSRPVSSPGELEGRTLLFDWMDYTGGRFEGYQICCQVVSVPGQSGLVARRRLLLESADAVVFVVDSAGEGLTAALDEAARVRASLGARRSEAPVGLIVQANKRDLRNALPSDALRRAVHERLPEVAVVEASATDGTGIRETFVFAVRLALDRVRELARSGRLRTGTPEVSSARDLAEMLESRPDDRDAADGVESVHAPAEADREPDFVQSALASVLAEQDAWRSAPIPSAAARSAGAPPLLPDDRVPSGMVWPPIEGRIHLHEATAERPSPVEEDGAWNALTETGWRMQAPASGTFRDIDEGRDALIRWARAHAALGRRLSHPRCVVLCPAGDGGFRLWQLVKRETTVSDLLDEAFASRSAERIADALLEGARLLSVASETGVGLPLPIGIDVLGSDRGNPVFTGLVPHPFEFVASASARGTLELLERELGAMVRARLEDVAEATPAIVDRVLRTLESRFELRDVATALVMVVLGETGAGAG